MWIFKNVKLESALDEIQVLGRFYFSYNSKVIKVNRLITYSSYNENIEIILDNILGKGFDYKHRGKYIIIQNAKPILSKKKKVSIKGKVSSSADSTQISDVTIYEVDKLKTTSTDKKGDFNLIVSTKNEEVSVIISKENYKDLIISSSDFIDTNLVIYLEPEKDTAKWKKFLKMDSIPWLKVFYTDKILNTIRNVELSENRKFQLSLIPFVGTNGKLSGKITNNVSLNLIGGYAYGLNGLEIGGVLNLISDTMKGVQISGFGNIVGGKSKGLQIAGAINYCHDSLKGFQIGGATNIAAMNVQGAQIGGACNFARNINDGGQIAGAFNFSNEIKNGAQISGAFNIASSINKGGQIGGAFNYSKSIDTGFQIAGAINFNRKNLKGIQIAGLLNYTKNLSGFQIGTFNFCDSVKKGIPIGFLSFVKSGFHKFELSYSNYLTGGISFRTGVHKFYNILSMDYYQNDSDPQLGIGYGIGTQVNFNKKIFSNLELSSRLIFPTKNFSSFNQINVLNKLNINFGYNFGRYLSIIGGPELNLFISNNSNPISNYDNFTKQTKIFSNTNNSNFVDMRLGYKIALRF